MTNRLTIRLASAMCTNLVVISGCVSRDRTNQSPDRIHLANTNIGDTGTEEETVDLVQFDQWSILDEHQDPYPTHRTADHLCDPSGILPEDELLEINTNECGYAVLGQPLQADIEPGDTVELLMYHSALSARTQPAEAHFSLLIGDHDFWDINIDIPWQSEVYLIPIEVDWSAEEGALVRVHLHNHGGNSWRVAYLRRNRYR